MAEGAGEKTQQATEQQVKKFRKEGRTATSKELIAAISLATGAVGIVMTGPLLARGLAGLVGSSFSHAAAPSLSSADVLPIVLGALVVVGPAVLGVLVPAAVVTTAAALLASGGNFTTDAIEPKLERLDPFAGAGNVLFSIRPWTGMLKGIAATILVGWAAWSGVSPFLDWIPAAPSWSPATQAHALVEIVSAVLARTVPAAFVLGAADYGWQWYHLNQEMMMTHQEVRDENKESDGDPQVKAQRRRRARQIAMNHQLRDVATADVIVTNPTHYAVALRYRKEENAAPVVVARGVDHFALQIRAAATRADVAIVENRPLARALHARTRPGQAIPADLFGPVARVLAAVYRRRKPKR
jgi:flagellar biosynthetic protein FlhB